MGAMYLFFSTFPPASSLGVHLVINIEQGLKMKCYGVSFVTSMPGTGIQMTRVVAGILMKLIFAPVFLSICFVVFYVAYSTS